MINNFNLSHQCEHWSSNYVSIDTIDPINKFISSLNSHLNLKVRIPSETNLLVDDFLENDKQININFKDISQTHIPSPSHLPNLFSNRRSPYFPTQVQKQILESLKTVPVYTVVNDLNEIVIASPRESNYLNSFDWIKQFYVDWFIWQKDEGNVNIGLFFMNKEDAEMYLHQICLKDSKGVENVGVKIKTISLNGFYKLNRLSSPRLQFKLIADLQEIKNILNWHDEKNISFHPKQKYDKNWFKGIPIYIFSPTITNLDWTLRSAKNLVFFSKNEAYDILKTLTNTKKNNFPNLQIYNLESFLLDLEHSSNLNIKQTYFIPLLETTNTSLANYNLSLFKVYSKFVERFYKGLIWLVTSDTLPSEENSW